MSVSEIALGTFLGCLGVWLLAMTPKFPFVVRWVRAKFHVWRFFRSQKSGVMKGFGIVVNGHPAMENNEPLLFDKYHDAEVEITKRDFDRVNPLTRQKNRCGVNWQQWNLDDGTLICSPVVVANGTK